MKIYYAPEKHYDQTRKSVFLAGTIDMGNSFNWQDKVIDELKEFDIDFFNPRRKEWDSSWEQSIENKQFVEQVEWELFYLTTCDIIIINFEENSKSPISLLELGAFKNKRKIYVCCPKKFYRRGNVEIFCKWNKIPLFEDTESLIKFVKNIL